MDDLEPKAAQAVDHILARAKAHGVVAGIHNVSPESALKRIAKGFVDPAYAGPITGDNVTARPDLVHDGMPAPARDERSVDGKRRQERDREGDGQAPPEQQVCQAGVEGAGPDEDDRVVDDLHDRDRQGVGRERQAQRGRERDPGTYQRDEGERIAEDEGQHDGDGDRRAVAPAEGRRDHETQDLADGAAGEAVEGGREREPVQACHGTPPVSHPTRL